MTFFIPITPFQSLLIVLIAIIITFDIKIIASRIGLIRSESSQEILPEELVEQKISHKL